MEPLTPNSRPAPLHLASKPQPLAYFITFRTYGTWLHGDARGSVDDRHNRPGTERLATNRNWNAFERSLLDGAPMIFTDAQRLICERAFRETCAYRKWKLRAVNVRTNHVHVVTTANETADRVMRDLKAYATRALRQHGLVAQTQRVWATHGSTRMLFTPDGVQRACIYTEEQQGAPARR